MTGSSVTVLYPAGRISCHSGITMDVSEIRRRLQIAPVAGVAWFYVDEKEVAFAPSKSPGRRPVILRDWPDRTPIAWVFARSASGRNGVCHDPHDHTADSSSGSRCRIDKLGRIVIRWPLTAKKSSLDHETAMCGEPDVSVTELVLAAPVRP